MENPPPVAPETPVDNPPDAGRKVKLLSLSDLDGRTGAARAVRALISDIEDDLGGADRMSAAEQQIAARAGCAGAMLQNLEALWISGRPIDIQAYTTLANTQSRLLKLLGLERRARDVTPTLSAYLAAKAAPPPLPPL